MSSDLSLSEATCPAPGRTRRPRYWIKTYGCQMNVHDSEIYSGLLAEMGYEAADGPEDADVILVNTCSVRERAEDKLFSKLGELREMKNEVETGGNGASGSRQVRIGVTGCIAQQRGRGIIDRETAVDFVIGTRAKQSLPDVLGLVESGAGPQVMTDDRVDFESSAARRSDGVKAFVTIMEGCDNYCSFCIVPATRGFEVYRPAAEILDEIRGLGIRGYREVTLLGQNVNSWVDPDTGLDFPGLLLEIDRALSGRKGGVERVRFLTSHPKDLSPALIEAMAEGDHIASHLHLPVQSGSDRVLERMNRHYTADRYLGQVEALRDSVPGVGLSTDLIVGFPGETEEDFRATMDLVRAVEYDSFFSFEYSPRPDTAALRYDDDVPADEKRRRLIELQRLGSEIQERRNAAWVGREADVLVDDLSKRSDDDVTGRTSSNHIVNAPGEPSLIGRLVRMRITDHAAHSLYGEVVGEPF